MNSSVQVFLLVLEHTKAEY